MILLVELLLSANILNISYVLHNMDKQQRLWHIVLARFFHKFYGTIKVFSSHKSSVSQQDPKKLR